MNTFTSLAFWIFWNVTCYWVIPDASRQCFVCMFPYLQHLKICFEEESCTLTPKILSQTAVKYEKKGERICFFLCLHRGLTGSGALFQWLSSEIPLGNVSRLNNRLWGVGDGVTLCTVGECGRFRALGQRLLSLLK